MSIKLHSLTESAGKANSPKEKCKNTVMASDYKQTTLLHKKALYCIDTTMQFQELKTTCQLINETAKFNSGAIIIDEQECVAQLHQTAVSTKIYQKLQQQQEKSLNRTVETRISDSNLQQIKELVADATKVNENLVGHPLTTLSWWIYLTMLATLAFGGGVIAHQFKRRAKQKRNWANKYGPRKLQM
jgi:hypothetical protein